MRFDLTIALALALLGCGSTSSPTVSSGNRKADAPPRMPCDPISSKTPVPAPSATVPASSVCGNGVIDQLVGDCARVCNGGCEVPIQCEVKCDTYPEHCDGDASTFSCESEGYAGGHMGCSSECNLDHSACVACVAGPATRCGTSTLTGDEVFATSTRTSAAVFTRSGEGGVITGATVTANLRTRKLSGLPRKTIAAGAIEGGLGFVDDRHRFGIIDAETGRTSMRGTIDESSPDIMILPETGGGGAAVLTGNYQRRTLAIFDPPNHVAPARPRHFHLGNQRIVVIPGGHELALTATTPGAALAIIAFGNDVQAFQRDGLVLSRLPSVPVGVELAFVYPTFTDKLRWSTNELRVTGRTSPDTEAPPPGLSRAAISGASTTSALGGTLFATLRRGKRPGSDLYWIQGPDALAPTLTVTPSTP